MVFFLRQIYFFLINYMCTCIISFQKHTIIYVDVFFSFLSGILDIKKMEVPMKLFIKPFWTAKKEPDESVCLEMQRQSLMRDMEKTKQAMEAAYSNFDNVTDPDLIDCYIYEVNAVLKRYKYLKEQADKLDLPPAAKITDPLCKEAPASSSFI